MKKLNQVPALIGFALGCVIIFISWLVATIFNSVITPIKTVASYSKGKQKAFREYNTGKSAAPSNYLVAFNNKS